MTFLMSPQFFPSSSSFFFNPSKHLLRLSLRKQHHIYCPGTSAEQPCTPSPPTDRLYRRRCKKTASKSHAVSEEGKKLTTSCLPRGVEDRFSSCQPGNMKLKKILYEHSFTMLITLDFLLLDNQFVCEYGVSGQCLTLSDIIWCFSF